MCCHEMCTTVERSSRYTYMGQHICGSYDVLVNLQV
jgi:hypothetical protein